MISSLVARVLPLTLAAALVLGLLALPAVAQPTRDSADDASLDGDSLDGDSLGDDAVEGPSSESIRGGFETWWQRKKIQEALDLTDEQIEQLDQLARETLEVIEESRTARNENFRAFSDALISGDRDEQAKYRERMADGVRSQAVARAEQMQQGIDLLTQAQRDKLVADFPQVFRQSWLSSAGVARRAAANPAVRIRRAGPGHGG